MSEPANTAAILSIPETEHGGMVAPGQENLLQEFLVEQEQAKEPIPEKLLGKFNSVEDLISSYQQLEKKLGQKTGEPPAEDQQIETYSTEQAIETYGQESVSALAEQGIDLASVMQQADNGEDISDHYEAIAEVFGVSKSVIENFVSKRKSFQSNSTEENFTDTQIMQLKNMAGGDRGFNELALWAVGNLKAEQLSIYNQAIDSGNIAAAQIAINWIQNLKSSPGSVVEPTLIGGGNAIEPRRFESQQQVLDAMNKKNNKGERLYYTDEAYRQKVATLLNASDVF